MPSRPISLLVKILTHIVEAFYSSDSDMKKDSNAQQTILAHTIDVASKILEERGLPVPRHIVFHVDLMMTYYVDLLGARFNHVSPKFEGCLVEELFKSTVSHYEPFELL